tara:strand:- start:5921 stop:6241 length:321 start_codon:yes stop_codon:yes gene_type:complete
LGGIARERAEIVHEILEERIESGYDLGNGDYLDAYKASFALKNKSISLYRRAFAESDLNFLISSVEAIYESFSIDLPGPGELTWGEKQILRELLNNINNGSKRAFF